MNDVGRLSSSNPLYRSNSHQMQLNPRSKVHLLTEQPIALRIVTYRSHRRVFDMVYPGLNRSPGQYLAESAAKAERANGIALIIGVLLTTAAFVYAVSAPQFATDPDGEIFTAGIATKID
jgi:hypothetical protein